MIHDDAALLRDRQHDTAAEHSELMINEEMDASDAIGLITNTADRWRQNRGCDICIKIKASFM